ncbi:MAG TPA: hypothetical protein VEQ65_11790, partial [Opitutus sp.]|nr:hypothetical protein [Opitutus sp.]
GPSPFLPPATSTDPVPTQDAAIELRGIMATDVGFMVSIYDSTHRSSTWLRLNETGREFVVRSHDAARDTGTVEHQGRTVTLALKTAKVSAAPAAQPVVANTPPPPNAPQPIGGPVVLNPTPADEQRRLEAIAAEVNRRRMLRQQALQASRAAAGQPAAGPTPTPTRPNGQQR